LFYWQLFISLGMPRFSTTKTGFFGLSFLKPKNPKGRKSDDRLKSIKPFRRLTITDIMSQSVGVVRSENACGCKVGGHGVERAIGRERNEVGRGMDSEGLSNCANDMANAENQISHILSAICAKNNVVIEEIKVDSETNNVEIIASVI